MLCVRPWATRVISSEFINIRDNHTRQANLVKIQAARKHVRDKMTKAQHISPCVCLSVCVCA